ncbi:unnamed protein product [Cuscuta europaea]|uniref:Uncharacterized protein n=1 Tax=Cuscuta europaea TaxID=41803 RepID=A0A9P0YMS4_CUSEU|nr:unnamed protein product [Cuscuta europaea]
MEKIWQMIRNSRITRAIKLMREFADNQTTDKIKQDSSRASWGVVDFEWDLYMNRDDSNQNDFSIYGPLFEVDIEQSAFCEKHLMLKSVEEQFSSQLSSNSSHANIRDCFQTTMTTGVDSLSHFLIKEFERIVTSCLENRDYLDKRLGEGAKECACQVVNPATETIAGNQCSLGSDWDDASVEKPVYSGDEFLGHASENEKRTPVSAIEDL